MKYTLENSRSWMPKHNLQIQTLQGFGFAILKPMSICKVPKHWEVKLKLGTKSQMDSNNDSHDAWFTYSVRLLV